MMLLIENAEVYAPKRIGRLSVLIAGGRIEKIAPIRSRTLARQLDIEVIDGSGCIVTPGLVDPHIHLIGGSGEEGFATQTPEFGFSELVTAGITSVVGTLGTDTTTRGMAALLARVKALREEGLGAWCWSGGYDARPLTGAIRDDIILIDEIIGAGEIAIADRRGPHYSVRQLARLATDCYVAGTLTGKAGLLHLHAGDHHSGLAILRELLDRFPVEPSTLYPTHVERNETLMGEAIGLLGRGAHIDLDVYEQDLVRWMTMLREAAADLSRVTISSDGAIKSPRQVLEQIRECVHEGVLSLDEALALSTANPARALKLAGVGELTDGARADLLILDQDSLTIREVIVAGSVVVRDGAPVRREKYLQKSNRDIRLRGAALNGNEKS